MNNEIQWKDASLVNAPASIMVRVIYADGMECDARRVSGGIFYPRGSDMYRYVNVIKWRELTVAEKAQAMREDEQASIERRQRDEAAIRSHYQ